LAISIRWTGTQLNVLGTNGTTNLRDKFIVGLAGTIFKRDGPHGVLIDWMVGGARGLLYLQLIPAVVRERTLRFRSPVFPLDPYRRLIYYLSA
jgi:hypothetical protein